jgi:DHA2 family multidrug resistance protein-like MFS transporter
LTITEPKATRREWIGLAVIALPCLLYSMDLTVLNLALPALSRELAPGSAQLLWIVDIYGFLVAGSLLTMGTVGDRIGRRRLLLIGAAAFGIASVAAAFSRSAGMLIVSRALLGVAGATLAPSTLSLIRNMFHDPRERTFAVSVWIMSYSVGAAIGPLLGGILLQHFPWGSVFLLSVPVMALLLIVGPRLLPEYRDPAAGRLDLWSAALSLAAVLSVIYGLKRMAEHGAGTAAVAAIAAGLLAGAVFVRRQNALADPLIDLRLFRVPTFSASLATYGLACFVAFGSYVPIAQYLQLVLGLSPLHAGLWTLPWSGGFVVGSLLAPALARRLAAPGLMAAGLLIGAAGFVLIARAGVSGGLPFIAVGSLLFSLGSAPAFTLANDMIITAAPPERAGAAAGISETSAELGGALGIAVLGSIGTVVYRANMAAASAGVPPSSREAARSTLGGAAAAASRLPDPAGAELLHAAREAFVRSLSLTAALCAAIAAATAVLTFVLLRRAGAAAEAAAD